MRIGRLVVALVTLTPPQAPPLPPEEVPWEEDFTVTAVPGVIDGRHAYVLRRNLAIVAGDLTFEVVMRKVIAGNAIKARLRRHFIQRTEPLLAARRRRAALLGFHHDLRRSA